MDALSFFDRVYDKNTKNGKKVIEDEAESEEEQDSVNEEEEELEEEEQQQKQKKKKRRVINKKPEPTSTKKNRRNIISDDDEDNEDNEDYQNDQKNQKDQQKEEEEEPVKRKQAHNKKRNQKSKSKEDKKEEEEEEEEEKKHDSDDVDTQMGDSDDGCVPDADYDFMIQCNQPQAMKNMVEIINNVLNECNFQIVQSDDFSGIKVESMDPRHLCMIIAKLSCRIKKFSPTANIQSFWVKTATLNTVLRTVSGRCCVQMSRSFGSENVAIAAFDPNSTSYELSFTLPTLDKENDCLPLNDIDYEYTVEFDLAILRSIIKLCHDIKAEDIGLTVMEPKQRSKVRSTYFIISAKGEASAEYVFHSVTEWNEKDGTDNSVIIRTASSPEVSKTTSGKLLSNRKDLQIQYKESFSSDYLNLFFKSMERHNVILRLSPGNPLVCHYPLGSDSYIDFVLAPKLKDENSA